MQRARLGPVEQENLYKAAVCLITAVGLSSYVVRFPLCSGIRSLYVWTTTPPRPPPLCIHSHIGHLLCTIRFPMPHFLREMGESSLDGGNMNCWASHIVSLGLGFLISGTLD